MPMTPIAVDKGAIYKKQAAEQVGSLASFQTSASKGWDDFKAEENKKWEEFVKQSETDTGNFYSNVSQLGQSLTANGVNADQLKASLFEMGFSNAMQGLPASHIRAAVSGMARQLLAPENKASLDKVSEQMKHVFDVPSKDEVLADVKSQIEEQAAAAGQEVPADKMQELMQRYTPQAEKAVEQRKTQVASLKEQLGATSDAMSAAGVPEGEKAGDMVLTGFMSGSELRKLQEQRQAAFMEMIQRLQAGGGEGAPEAQAQG